MPVDQRRAAASDLCSYRYSKRKALEIADSDGTEGFSFVMLAPGQQPVKSLPAAERKVEPPPLTPPRAAAVGGALPPDHIPANVEFA